MPQRLTKLDAAATLGVSPSTIDRMIQREELTIEKETRGSRYKVWVLLDDEAGPSPEPSSDGSLESAGDASSDLSEPSSGGSIDESFWGELITLRERVKGLEELSDYHKQQNFTQSPAKVPPATRLCGHRAIVRALRATGGSCVSEAGLSWDQWAVGWCLRH